MRLYDTLYSGNGYKVRLVLSQLGIAFERVEIDILDGESRTPEFLARNPNGRIPVLELDDGSYLAESNAICWYLAEGSRLLPSDRLARARVLQWMCFEQYSHEPYLATSRFWIQHLPMTQERRRGLQEKRAPGIAALSVMEGHLATHAWFVGDAYTLADIALFAYTHVADEGGFDLAPFPAIRAWIGRVTAEPGHVPITYDFAPASGGRR